MIHFVCFKWTQPGYRSKFTAAHVNILRRMLMRNCTWSHRLVCVTDDTNGIDKDIACIPLWPDHAALANASWSTGPSCYRRLRIFSKEFAAELDACSVTDVIVSIDLDLVIIGCIDLLLRRLLQNRGTSALYMWGTGEKNIPVCGSLMGFSANGSLASIWESFNGRASAKAALATMLGSDQAHIAHVIGIDYISRWTQYDGVYSMGHDLCYGISAKRLITLGAHIKPPANASIVVFNGKPDPWECLMLPWVKEHYR